MKSRMMAITVISLALLSQRICLFAQPPEGDKDPAKTPIVGDRDDVIFQNQRYLNVKNDTSGTLTVFLQYRTLVDGAFKWLPVTPADGAEAVSFEIKAGEETQVKVGEELIQASRVRIWASGESQKWLTYKTRDLWLVPEKNEEGDHVYPAQTVETFAFTFASQKADTDDPDAAAGSTFPEEDPGTLPDVLPDPGSILPDGGTMPCIRDLVVRPISVFGVNAVIPVKNRGHATDNLGRRLLIRRTTPGSLPFDVGPIGPLYHNGVRVFYVGGLMPGDYIAYVSPGDDFPYDGNDIRPFTVGMSAFADLRVMPVSVVGAKATVKVKNVGGVPALPGRKVRVTKVGPPAVMIELGTTGPLPVNGVDSFGPVTLAPGTYKAFITPGDAMPHALNDSWTFVVSAASFADLKILPVGVFGGNVNVSVKNVGFVPSAAGKNLLVVKLTPGSMPMNKGAIPPLAPGGIKTFAPFPLPPGNYKAYLSPGDAPPNAGNDADNFIVAAAPFIDLKVMNVTVSGDEVQIKVKNIGTALAPAGRHLKVVKLVPGSMPIDKGPVGALPPGITKVFPNFSLPPGDYKAFIDPGDPLPHAGNDFDNFTVGGPAPFADLAMLNVTVSGDDVHVKVKNVGTLPVPAGRQLKVVKVTPGSIPMSKGAVGPLAPGATKFFASFSLAPGTYKAFIDPGDPVLHAANDSDTFTVSAAPPSVDLAVMNVIVSGDDVHVKVKNVGTVPAPVGRHLKVVKNVPGSPVMDKGLVGPLPPGATKVFPPFSLPPGSYKAFIDPGDTPPNTANDSDLFTVVGGVDLGVSEPTKVGAKVRATIKNHGPGAYAGGLQWHLEKKLGPVWMDIGSGAVPPLAVGASITVQGDYSGGTLYRIRLSGTDSNNANNSETKGL